MSIVLDLLVILSLRFLFFDFGDYQFIRDWFKTKFECYVVCKILKCSYCQGFWCGLFYYWIVYGFEIKSIYYGFASAILSFSWVCFMESNIDYVENKDIKK